MINTYNTPLWRSLAGWAIMDEYINYDALATSMKIKDITPCKRNQMILRKLSKNDPDFDEMWIRYNLSDDDSDYKVFGDGEDLGWLGYFLGRNTSVEKLYLHTSCMNVENLSAED